MSTNVQMISQSEVEVIVPKVVAQANQFAVTTADDYEMGASCLTMIARRKKEVAATFDPIIEKAHEAHKEACAQKKKFLDPLLTAETTVKNKMIAWDDEQERIRVEREKEEQRLADEKAKAEEAERARLAKIENDKRTAAAIEEAAQLEAQGEGVLAEIVLQHAAECEAMAPPPPPVMAAPVVVASAVPTLAEVARTTNWDFEITNQFLIPRSYLMVNEVAIRAAVKTQKGLTQIPGVRVFPKKGIKTTGR